MGSRDYKDLDAWKVGMELTVEVYGLTNLLPDEEKFGLKSQMRRSAISIPSNVAEGSQRGSNADFARFVLIARGSVAELETQVEIGRRLGFWAADRVQEISSKLVRLRQMLSSLQARLTTYSADGVKEAGEEYDLGFDTENG